MAHSAFILWLERTNPEHLSMAPSVQELAARGVDLELTPLPLVVNDVCYYQTLTGMGPGRIGRFDAVRPLSYTARAESGVPEGVWERLLPDILRARQVEATFLEVGDRDTLERMAVRTDACTIVRLLNMGTPDVAALNAIVRRCMELSGPAAHLILLTDVWAQAPAQWVNVNDFLADVGLLELGASRNAAGVVWPETLAYGLGAGQVWVNLRGREPQGIVMAGREYQEVCDALVNALQNEWRDPETGTPVVAQVLKKEEAYTGEYLFKAPDLIVVYRPGYVPSPQAAALDFDGASIQSAGWPAAGAPARAPYARLIAAGPALASGVRATANLIDVVPSVLYLLGQPIPQHVEGQVIPALFSEAYRDRAPILRAAADVAPLSDEEEHAIMSRLQALGYLG